MGLIERLVRLANELSDDDAKRTYAGDHETPRSRINYGVSVGPIDSGRSKEQRSQSRQRRQEYLTNTRTEEDELVVTVDLLGVSKEDIGVTFDAETGTVEIRDGERPIKRLGLEWEDATVTNASYNNHVLELRIERELPDE
ncbi:gas vesicle protein GvpH [Haladaptatus sp. CMAA 1911]|uniref:gas vesicle protein GvpH n=1 Tax=unclassified Haladaptatus TaxID=2622732 RepID=UPI00375470F2